MPYFWSFIWEIVWDLSPFHFPNHFLYRLLSLCIINCNTTVLCKRKSQKICFQKRITLVHNHPVHNKYIILNFIWLFIVCRESRHRGCNQSYDMYTCTHTDTYGMKVLSHTGTWEHRYFFVLRQAQREVKVAVIRGRYLGPSQVRGRFVCSYGYSSLRKRNWYLVFSKRSWIPIDWHGSVGAHHLLQSHLRYLKLVTNLQGVFEILAPCPGLYRTWVAEQGPKAGVWVPCPMRYCTVPSWGKDSFNHQ